MASVEHARIGDLGRGQGRAPHRGHAFGLDVRSTYEIPALSAKRSGVPTRRSFCSEQEARALDRSWPEAESARAVELRFPDGRLFMSITRHPELGYRIWAPRHGRHVVSRDGSVIRSALPNRSTLAWQRLFFAQALPLAAALQGLEVLHASAVGLGGRAVAFTAESGTGKSSLAAHFVATGATFLTDDVLALEQQGEGVVAHPGPTRANVSMQELRSMPPAERQRLGPHVGRSDKAHVEPGVASSALPLAILYRLTRCRAGKGPLLREQHPPEPRLILASSFLAYLRTPERLLNQLAVCERIASSVRLFEVGLPVGMPARASAAIVRAHAEGVLAE